MNKDAALPLLMDFYGSLLPSAQYDDVNYYYEQDLSLSEISDNVGKTRQGVYDSVKKAEASLYDFESKLGFVKKTENIQNVAFQIEQAAQKMKSLSSDENTLKYAQKIIDLTAKLMF